MEPFECGKKSRQRGIGASYTVLVLLAVAVAEKVEVEREDALVKRRLEAAPVRLLPLAVDDAEGDVLVWRACVEEDDARRAVLGLLVGQQLVRRCLALVDEVGVKDLRNKG